MVLSGANITAKNYAYVFGKNRLMGQCQFTVTFTKIHDFVYLGVGDTQNKKGSFNCNQVFYQNNGFWYVEGICQGNCGVGYKVGEPATVVVDLTTGSIQWKVGKQIRHQFNYDKLKDKNITWVPFIYLRSNDSVMINE